jgi:hypothetical protein
VESGKQLRQKRSWSNAAATAAFKATADRGEPLPYPPPPPPRRQRIRARRRLSLLSHSVRQASREAAGKKTGKKTENSARGNSSRDYRHIQYRSLCAEKKKGKKRMEQCVCGGKFTIAKNFLVLSSKDGHIWCKS